MSFHTWLSYAVVCVLFAITPGPAVILSVGQAVAKGAKSGLAVVAGIQSGNAIYFAVSAVGLGAVMATSEMTFLLLKYAGALYLIYLGLRTIRNARASALEGPNKPLAIWQKPFSQGIVNQLANPKSVLFFGALFPQFIDYHAANLVTQFLTLGATVLIVDGCVLAIYVTIAANGRNFMKGENSAIWRERVSGAALVAVGGAMTLIRRTP